MAKESKMHKELFDWLRKENLPEKDISRNEKEWFIEIAVGFERLGMEKPDLSESYKRAEERIRDENLKRILRKQRELGLVDYDLYQGIAKREWSGKHGIYANLIQSIDYLCIIGKRAWVLEGKKDPNHEAIGQVLVYSDLFKEDYPMFEEIKMGIVCKEPSPLNEPTCDKLGIRYLEVVMMYNFEVALAFASLKTDEALAYARMIMDGTNPYEEFNWFKDFDASKLPDEAKELKNYDAAIALAAAGRMDEAYFVVKEINIHKKLDPEHFQKLDWSADIKRLIDSATEKYKTFAIEKKKSFDFKNKRKIKNKCTEYPEPSDNSLLLKDS